MDWWLVEPTWLLSTFCLVLGKSICKSPMKIQMKIPTSKILEKTTASSSRNCSVAIADRNVWKRARDPPVHRALHIASFFTRQGAPTSGETTAATVVDINPRPRGPGRPPKQHPQQGETAAHEDDLYGVPKRVGDPSRMVPAVLDAKELVRQTRFMWELAPQVSKQVHKQYLEEQAEKEGRVDPSMPGFTTMFWRRLIMATPTATMNLSEWGVLAVLALVIVPGSVEAERMFSTMTFICGTG